MATVSTRHEEVHLTPTDRRLLTYLVRNAGRVVSHREPLEAMSSGNPSTSIHNLRAYVSRLRNKIEVDRALPVVIITHHRRGYSLAGKGGARWFQEVVSRIGTMMLGGALGLWPLSFL